MTTLDYAVLHTVKDQVERRARGLKGLLALGLLPSTGKKIVELQESLDRFSRVIVEGLNAIAALERVNFPTQPRVELTPDEVKDLEAAIAAFNEAQSGLLSISRAVAGKILFGDVERKP